MFSFKLLVWNRWYKCSCKYSIPSQILSLSFWQKLQVLLNFTCHMYLQPSLISSQINKFQTHNIIVKAYYSPIDVNHPFQLHLKPYPLVWLNRRARKLFISQSHLRNRCTQRDFQNYANTNWRMGGLQKNSTRILLWLLSKTIISSEAQTFLLSSSICLEMSNLCYPNVHLCSFSFLN